jgi:FtsH-binding integral membrane protein
MIKSQRYGTIFQRLYAALAVFISARIDAIAAQTARYLFFIYTALVGVSTSPIFHIYTDSSVTRVFFISAATFGGALASVAIVTSQQHRSFAQTTSVLIEESGPHHGQRSRMQRA